MPDEYLNMPAIAEMAHVAQQTVRWWRSTGQLPPADVVVGKVPGWLPETIELWLEQRR